MRLRHATILSLAVVVACGGAEPGSETAVPTGSTDAVSTTAPGGGTTAASITMGSTTTMTVPASTTTTSIVEDQDGAAGTGLVLLDGEPHDVEVLACGWLSAGGSDEPLEPEPNARNDFRLTVFEQVGDRVFVLDLDRDGQVGVAYIDVLGAVIGSDRDDPGNFVWGNDRQSFDRVDVVGGVVSTVEPLTILEAPVDRFSTAHEVELDVTCTEFGGIPDEFAEVVATAAGIELPDFGATGLITIDDVEYPVETVSCSIAGGGVEGVAESPDDDLVVAVTDLGTEAAGILSDTIGIDIGDRSLIADDDVDIVIDGTVLRTGGPAQLFDIFTREPAGVVTVAIDCG